MITNGRNASACLATRNSNPHSTLGRFYRSPRIPSDRDADTSSFKKRTPDDPYVRITFAWTGGHNDEYLGTFPHGINSMTRRSILPSPRSPSPSSGTEISLLCRSREPSRAPPRKLRRIPPPHFYKLSPPPSGPVSGAFTQGSRKRDDTPRTRV